MATFVASSTAYLNTSDGPGNLPTGLQDGDLVIMYGGLSRDAAYTLPAGFTLATRQMVTRSTRTTGSLIAYYVATAADAGKEVTWTGIGDYVQFHAYRGVTNNVVKGTPTTTQATTSTTAPGITTSLSAGSLLLIAYSAEADTGGSVTFPAGYNVRHAGDPFAAFEFPMLDLLSTTAGTTSDVTITYSVTEGSTTGFQVAFLSNTAPNAPTLTAPANNATLDRAVTQRFDWDFSDPDTGDSQSKYDLQYRVEGTATWTVVSGTTTNTFHDFAGGTFAAGDYEWQVRTYDAQGLVGPYSASSFFTAADAPVAPTITAPVSGGTVGPTFTVTWSYPSQAAYQVRRVADNAGSPNTATVYSDTGVVESTTARSQSVSFPVNGRYEHVQVRIRDTNGLYSAYASHRVLVSYTPPAVPWARVTPDSSSASIAVDVVNSTAWGYGGSGSAKNAASAALIDLAALGVARVLWLPGAAGNYVSTPDRNMLPAHADSFEDGTTGGWAVVNGTATNVTAWAYHGTRSVEVSKTAQPVTHISPTFPVTAGATYTASAWIDNVSARVSLDLNFLDSGGVVLAESTRHVTTATGVQRLVSTGTAPAGAVSANVRLFDDLASTTTGTWRQDAVQVEQAGSASPFTPSLRVTGDLDLRAHVALEDWTPSRATLISKNDAYLFLVDSTGALALWTYPGGTFTATNSTVVPSIADGTAKHVRATRSAAGEVRFYTSDDGATWTEIGAAQSTSATALATASSALLVGSRGVEEMKGKVLSASVRAGIDGPEVAAYDATAHTDATFTDSTGKAWTVSRSGDATAEIVDRTTWAFTGSEYLTLPDRDSLDFGAGEAFTVAGRFATRLTGASLRLLEKRDATGPGYLIYHNTGGRLAFFINDDTGTAQDVLSAPSSDAAWRTIAAERTASGHPAARLDNGDATPDTTARGGSLAGSNPLRVGADRSSGNQWRGFISWVALFRRTLTTAEHATLAAWDGSINTEPEFLRTGAALYVNAADSNQRTQYTARNLVLNLARTEDEGGVASDLPVVTENRVWRSELLPSGQWSTPMRVKLGLIPDGVWVDYTPASGREYRYEVEAIGDNGTAARSGLVT